MSYQYRFTKQVEKFLEKQSRDFLVLFQSKLEILIQNPFTSELDTKPLKGLPHNYRLRV
jgi:mRNA-degrading endonuclease RelE of RelBE toxin-antitoxin system